MEDWYSVTLTDLKELGFPKAFTRTRLAELLTKKYPEYKWEKGVLLRGRYKQQRRLEKVVASLFPVCIICSIYSILLNIQDRVKRSSLMQRRKPVS